MANTNNTVESTNYLRVLRNVDNDELDESNMSSKYVSNVYNLSTGFLSV